MSLVLDSSVTLAWLHADEGGGAIDAVLDQVVSEGAWVPSLWRLEVANSLTVAVRRGRITPVFRDQALADLALMAIAVDPHTDEHAWQTTLHLAERHALTLYDAAYLELARRLAVPLATLDQALRSAARAAGVGLLGAAEDV